MQQRQPPSAPRRPDSCCRSVRLQRLLLLGAAAIGLLLLSLDASRLSQLSLLQTTSTTASPTSSVELVSIADSSSPGSSSADPVEQAERHARSVKMLPSGETRQRNWRCIGWRATRTCSPYGPRLPDLDRPCAKVVPNGDSGYCELEDADSGERFRVMRRYCGSLKYDARFRCDDAASFANFHLQAQEVANKALVPGYALPNAGSGRNGIVMVVYPKLLPSAYATVRTLREVLRCRLPIEIWYRPRELRNVDVELAPLRKLAENATNESEITFHEINDGWATGFTTKIFAITRSFFEGVLFLDADNVPVRDPSFLFDTTEYKENGAIFWPDFWQPARTIFGVNAHSLVWEMLDLPFVNMFEQESGQLLINLKRHAAPLELVSFYAFHQPNLFMKLTLVHGDKDLFRFAWMKLKATYHMIQSPPAVAGKVINGSFCGMTMVQHDAQGEILFLHRNSNKLLGGHPPKTGTARLEAIRRERNKRLRIQKGLNISEATPKPTTGEPDGYPDPIFWTHVLSFNETSRRSHYVIETYNADPEFSKEQNCYGQRYIGSNPAFYAREVANLSFAGLENNVRRFAYEAVQLRHEKEKVFIKSQPPARRHPTG